MTLSSRLRPSLDVSVTCMLSASRTAPRGDPCLARAGTSLAQLPRARWCGRRDSNPHDLRHRNLNPARLPVPPRPRAGCAARLTLDAIRPGPSRRSTLRVQEHVSGQTPVDRDITYFATVEARV